MIHCLFTKNTGKIQILFNLRKVWNEQKKNRYKSSSDMIIAQFHSENPNCLFDLQSKQKRRSSTTWNECRKIKIKIIYSLFQLCQMWKLMKSGDVGITFSVFYFRTAFSNMSVSQDIGKVHLCQFSNNQNFRSHLTQTTAWSEVCSAMTCRSLMWLCWQLP